MAVQERLGSRHPDGARRLPTACRRRAVIRDGGRPDRGLGGAGPGGVRGHRGRRRARPVRCSASCRAAPTLDLRAESAARTVELGFDGYALGGLSVGETGRPRCSPPLAAVTAMLPADQPRYFMGLGRPGRDRRVRRAGRRHVRLRPAHPAGPPRHVLTDAGPPQHQAGRVRSRRRPLDPDRPGSPCARFPRGYLRHLLHVDEPTAARLLTMHNLSWMLQFVADMRAAIDAGRFDAFRAEVRAVWSRG